MIVLSSTQRKRQFKLAVLALALTATLLAGCSASNSDSASKSADNAGIMNSAKVPAAVVEKGEMLRNSSYDLSKNSAAGASSGESEQAAAADSGGASIATGAAAANAEAFKGKIIYSANLSMRVEDISATGAELRDIIHGSGGYILQFSDSRYDGEIGSVYTIKVPADGFMPFVDRIAVIPNLKFQQSISGKDVSEEYVDLESRLKAKRIVEDRLLSLMEKAEKADDLLKFSNQLSTVQEEIERILGRIRDLDANVAYSTVELRVYQLEQKVASALEQDEKPFGTKLADSLTGSASAVWKGLQMLLIFIVGALPVLAVLAVIGVPIYLYVKHRRKLVVRPVKLPADGDSTPEG